MYIRNNVYPYSVAQLKQENPQTSFPAQISDALLAEYSMFPVERTSCPAVGFDKNVTEGQPELVDGAWKQVWIVTDASAEEHLSRVLEARANEYPPMSDYVDGVVKGDQTQIDKYIADCLAVKAKYPKPTL
jgi:hypothetical protein